ncbi:MAG: hypothetical protein AAF870_08440, partial [Pseudomonadota bacterium]
MNEQVRSIGVDEPTRTKTTVPVASYRFTDVLLASIEYFCAHHNLPFSASRALRGVPTSDGRLKPDSYQNACENVGLLARSEQVKPSSVSKMAYPFLVYFPDGVVGIATNRKSDNTIELFLFDHSGNRTKKSMKARQCDRLSQGLLHYVTRLPETSTTADSVTEPEKHWFWSKVRRFWPNWSYVVFATFLINLLG